MQITYSPWFGRSDGISTWPTFFRCTQTYDCAEGECRAARKASTKLMERTWDLARYRMWLILLMLWTCADACARDQLPPLQAGARILAFGDSLTSGVGGSGENYPDRLALRIRRTVINAGSNGETTSQGRARLPQELRKYKPDLLILCLGINDLSRGIPREQILENLIAMLDSAREAGVPVLLLALPTRAATTVDPLFAEAARAGDAVLDEYSMAGVLADLSMKSDLVHLTPEGYRSVADRVAVTLHERGAVEQGELP